MNKNTQKTNKQTKTNIILKTATKRQSFIVATTTSGTFSQKTTRTAFTGTVGSLTCIKQN